MKGFFRKRLAGIYRGKAGFTLVELLVVVGIIGALAAIIIPNVVQFSGEGVEAAKSAELDTVQAAMDTMMADQGITAVTARDNSVAGQTGLNDFTSAPAEGPLVNYLRDNPTQYYYCWTGAGIVYAQLLAAADACPAP